MAGRPMRQPRRARNQSWHEIMWRLVQIRNYLETTVYHRLTPEGEAKYCNAEPIFEILEQVLRPDFFNTYNSPNGGFDADGPDAERERRAALYHSQHARDDDSLPVQLRHQR